jgi:hypothetical protein
MSWDVVDVDGVLHVLPSGDLKRHGHSMDCWCRPTMDDGVVAHNSMDRREEYERGDRRSS